EGLARNSPVQTARTRARLAKPRKIAALNKKEQLRVDNQSWFHKVGHRDNEIATVDGILSREVTARGDYWTMEHMKGIFNQIHSSNLLMSSSAKEVKIPEPPERPLSKLISSKSSGNGILRKACSQSSSPRKDPSSSEQKMDNTLERSIKIQAPDLEISLKKHGLKEQPWEIMMIVFLHPIPIPIPMLVLHPGSVIGLNKVHPPIQPQLMMATMSRSKGAQVQVHS
ncbi:hypothetical protein MMC22_011864, partial [Lobaria immixta]|nr:hypothetical protein [Lobaria immixta]